MAGLGTALGVGRQGAASVFVCSDGLRMARLACYALGIINH